MTRVFLAGVLGGIGMFTWTHLSYTVLPFGETGLREIPNETAVLNVLQNNIGEKSGLYIFPGPGLGSKRTDEQKAKAADQLAESVARYPSGMLMYNAAGARPIELFRWLSVEFVTELIESIFAVLLLSQTRLTTFAGRTAFVLAIGFLVAIGANVPNWTWYGFSASYTLANMLIQVVGFLCVGLVAALVLRKQTLPATSWPRFLPGISRAISGR